MTTTKLFAYNLKPVKQLQLNSPDLIIDIG